MRAATFDHDKAKAAVLRVGGGRGFVVEGQTRRWVITAAHCLPKFPPCEGLSTLEDRTYERFLGWLGQEQEVWAECLFADPVGDVALLGPPDPAELHEQYVAYEALMEAAIPLPVTDMLPEKERPAWVLSLDGCWWPVVAQYFNHGPLVLSNTAEDIKGGMSGSPIVADDGSAIGLVSVSSDDRSRYAYCTGPRLCGNLPGWLLRELDLI
jgi:hypothetical protein